MVDSRRSLASALCVVGLLALTAWAYRGDVWRLIGGNAASASPSDSFNPYPAQYLPAVLVLPTPSPVPPPLAVLHVGLQLRWDGSGYIFFDGYSWRPGTHLTRIIDQQVDSDTVREAGRQWYSPNPLNFSEDNWYCHRNTVTNRAETCSGEDDPAWKWGYPWIMPSDVGLANGQRATIDGQAFDVTGPHTFLTGYGEEATFWRLRNRNRFLYHYSGGEWKQYVEAGDVTLLYEVGSGILLYDNVKRTYYKNDQSTSNYVQYESLISENAGLLNVSAELRGPLPSVVAEENALSTDMAAVLAEAGIAVEQLTIGR